MTPKPVSCFMNLNSENTSNDNRASGTFSPVYLRNKDLGDTGVVLRILKKKTLTLITF